MTVWENEVGFQAAYIYSIGEKVAILVPVSKNKRQAHLGAF